MKIRVYSPEFPYPLTGGAQQVITDQIRILVEAGHEVELVTWKNPTQSLTEIRRELPSDLALSRIRVISFAGPGTRPETRNARAMRTLGSLGSPMASPEAYYYPESSDQREILGRADIGIYHYSFAHAWLARGKRARSPEKKIIVHFHNLESELSLERVKLGSPSALIHQLNARKLDQHEKELSEIADELWFVSPEDLKRYAGRGPAPRKLVTPTYSPEIRKHRHELALRTYSNARSAPLIAGFVGTLDFGPNRSSLAWILDELVPRLKARDFRGKIQVVGRGAPADLVARMQATGGMVQYHGFVADLEAFWANLSFLLVPHVTGSGVRVKLLEALASGVPVLANSAAVSRIHPDLARSPLVIRADDPAQWLETLTQEAPLALRQSLDHLPFPSALATQPAYAELRA